jgi:dTDP-glucose 4,6-dehydratase
MNAPRAAAPKAKRSLGGKSVLVTGGAGFIGSRFVHRLLAAYDDIRVVVLDKLTYAGNPRSIALLDGEPRFRFVRGDIADRALVRELLLEHRPSALVHLAAESHVDRSIVGPDDFIHTNVVGTFHLLDEVRRLGDALPGLRFLHVSTDEVYGALGPTGVFDERSPYQPSSPYSASKAASDHLVRAYGHTYGVPVLVTHCSNNYGPFQYPEKLIPLTIAHALAGKPLPVYGQGLNVRDWIHVADHCRALQRVLAGGRPGETYAIGARSEHRNLDLVRALCAELDRQAPRPGRHEDAIAFVADRPGHDFRYALDPAKIERELGWRPEIGFAEGLRQTVAWYLEHPAWLSPVDGRSP